MGYRNIYYDVRKGVMKLWNWDEKGNRILSEFPFKPYVYVESQSVKDATSIYNTSLRKIEFRNQFERRKYTKESGIKRIFYNINAEQQFLIDHFEHVNGDPTFSKNQLKTFFLDIEVYAPNGFPEAKQAKEKVNLITIYDSLSNHYYTWGLENSYKAKTDNNTYFECVTETDLLRKFIRFWEADCPDVLTGWNIEGFDVPYLMNRIGSILGEDWAKRLSPIGQIHVRDGVVKRFGKLESKWYIKGVSIIDYMEAYKIFHFDKRESYALNHIGEVELGEGKVAHNATSLSDLADNDWDTFVDYNIQDVNILVQLEKKLQFLELSKMLGYLGLTPFESTLGTIAIVTGAMAIKARKNNLIIPTFEMSNTATYEGGYVKEPNRGFQDAVVSFDANSLYPNTIISLNISPETKLGKIISKSKEEVEILLTNGKEYTLPMKQFAQFVKNEKVAISKAKVLYTQKVKGFCPELVEEIYNDRVDNKNKLKDHKRSIAHCKEGSDSYKHHKEMINHYNIMQYTLKILANRLYGTFANKYSPFCDIDAASSITLTGQACVKQASEIVNSYVKETYNTDKDLDLNVYSDTDSCYFTLQPILDKIKKSFFNDKNRPRRTVYKLADELQEVLNIGISDWAKNSLNSIDPRFVFKRESICDTGVFIQKKRYILHIMDDEGDEVDKIKYVGVEVKSSGISKTVKPMIERTIETMLRTKDVQLTNNIYGEGYKEFESLSIEEISFPRGLHTFQKYVVKSSGFNVAKGTPLAAKAAIYYNQLLKQKGVEKKYEEIKEGTKIKYFYTAPNKYNIQSIAFLDKFPSEFDVEMNRKLMFKKTVAPLIERLFLTVGWRVKDPTSEVVCDLFELLG